MSKADEIAKKYYPVLFSERNGYDNNGIQRERRNAFANGYEQAIKDLWHNVKTELPKDEERILLIKKNGVYATTLLSMPLNYKELMKWEKWAYIKDLIPSE